MKPSDTQKITRHLLAYLHMFALIAGIGMALMALPARQALAQTVTYKYTDNKKELDNPGTTYVIQGDGKSHKGHSQLMRNEQGTCHLQNNLILAALLSCVKLLVCSVDPFARREAFLVCCDSHGYGHADAILLVPQRMSRNGAPRPIEQVSLRFHTLANEPYGKKLFAAPATHLRITQAFL